MVLLQVGISSSSQTVVWFYCRTIPQVGWCYQHLPAVEPYLQVDNGYHTAPTCCRTVLTGWQWLSYSTYLVKNHTYRLAGATILHLTCSRTIPTGWLVLPYFTKPAVEPYLLAVPTGWLVLPAPTCSRSIPILFGWCYQHLLSAEPYLQVGWCYQHLRAVEPYLYRLAGATILLPTPSPSTLV
jgi:hypothetical protein